LLPKSASPAHGAQDEIIRVIDAIQLGDKHRIATPVNWKQGEDVIVHASVGAEEAKTLFPEHKVHLVSISLLGISRY
jgi:hypothetical protein